MHTAAAGARTSSGPGLSRLSLPCCTQLAKAAWHAVTSLPAQPPSLQEPYTLFVLHMSASGQPGEEEETWVLEPQGRRLLCMDTNVNVMKGKGYTSTDSITVIKAEAAGRLQRALEAVVAAGYPDKSSGCHWGACLGCAQRYGGAGHICRERALPAAA